MYVYIYRRGLAWRPGMVSQWLADAPTSWKYCCAVFSISRLSSICLPVHLALGVGVEARVVEAVFGISRSSSICHQ